MSGKLRLNGATSGYSELQAPDVAGDQTFTLPAVGGELATKSGGGQVVGYQEGIATITSNAPVGSQGAYWVRIGNFVTMQIGMLFNAGISSQEILLMQGIPYLIRAAPDGQSAAAGTGGYICYASTTTVDSILFNSDSSFAFRDGAGGRPSMSMNLFSNADVRFVLQYTTGDTTWAPINGATIS